MAQADSKSHSIATYAHITFEISYRNSLHQIGRWMEQAELNHGWFAQWIQEMESDKRDPTVEKNTRQKETAITSNNIQCVFNVGLSQRKHCIINK